jgi:WhiB family redox-sensing transcriptional regulator
MAARVTWDTFSVRATSHRQPPPHPALHPDAPTALCSQTDPEVFFPGVGESARHAAAACLACELRYWGGSTERDRARERTRRARHATTPAAEPAPERRAA